ncbi:DEKNAAC102529 [Brettanomyces naardenensis]|uniref:DEKNAAC102529 n=1 Tax=Brettanomyces naardenensis TaxID=13370 RepID=A0A448YLK6_BRENA|nr:DEKNAAC102529 [Brettanomyces naardenensis]
MTLVNFIATTDFNYLHTTFLTFQAVIEVVIVCLSGFWAASHGLLSNDGTKVISRLNVDLFTPALIFTKLASSLSLKKLLEVIIIPILYAITTLVSYVAANFMGRVLDLSDPESNFVTAMAVFGNSNSLPVSLTLALAYTLPGLEWDDVDDDTPDKIASRGLVYLLIFQQLGQMLRWSWGYNSLLKKQPHDVIYSGEPDTERRELLPGSSDSIAKSPSTAHSYGSSGIEGSSDSVEEINDDAGSIDSENGVTMLSSDIIVPTSAIIQPVRTVSRTAGGQILVEIEDKEDTEDELLPEENTAVSLAEPEQQSSIFKRAFSRFMGWMNPPLWSMLTAIFVASIPPIRYQFYEANGFIQNTLAKSIKELGSVSIPLILVVLGANLAPSSDIPPACKHYKRMIFGSLVSRMVLPSIVLLPLIAFCVRYIRLSIMDDPIFLITSFLLITSPPAIQLSQICQLNEIYQKEMAGVLFYGYAVLTLPVTIFIVVSALQCMQWARPLA